VEDEMTKPEDSLCERHREFVPLIAAIDRVSGELDQGSALLIRSEAWGIHETLSHELLPHAVGEGRTLFPVLRRVTGSTAMTNEMLAEHREISQRVRAGQELRDRAGEVEAADWLVDEHTPAVGADHPLDGHPPAVRRKLVAGLAADHPID
jgi:iron-sulfur cluster repair protein YtfE (RIC family)